MRIKHCIWASFLIVLCVQPAFAECQGDYLDQHLDGPMPSKSGDELALVKIVAVVTDAKPQAPWRETGTLKLSKVESTGKHLPTNFCVHYEKRLHEGWDCQTWDFVELKPGKRLLGFFHLENNIWSVPELPAKDVINNVEEIDDPMFKAAQRLFRTRLLLPGTHRTVWLHF